MMNKLAGRIEVTIGWRDGRISSVDIHNSRPAVVSRLLQGKTYTEALTLIPMLFSVCGVAQQIAATEAVESALQTKAVQTEILQTEAFQTELLKKELSASVSRARQQLLLAENIRELGLRMARDWLDDRLMAQQLMQWFVRIRAELQWSLALNAQAQDQIQEKATKQAKQNLKMTELIEDVRSILPGQYQLNECRQQLERAFGDIRLNPGVSAMPALNSKAMMQLLPEIEWSLKSEAGFARQPSVLGQCYETGYAISDAEEKARQTLPERFDRFVSALMALPDQLLQPTPMILRNNQGMALVTAARGVLIHRVSLQGDSVSDYQVSEYQIVAPTEWNFHPQGALLSMLEGVAVEYDRLEALVNRLIVLVDPCVDWSVGIRKDHA
ncbi:MAG: nickel-dependent hydrogenase large subunit [Amphritea sp.]|nr:nickel-dependent hydrogenase large subunit [Amphritea sp.]